MIEELWDRAADIDVLYKRRGELCSHTSRGHFVHLELLEVLLLRPSLLSFQNLRVFQFHLYLFRIPSYLIKCRFEPSCSGWLKDYWTLIQASIGQACTGPCGCLVIMGYYCTHPKCLPNPEEESPRISRASYSCLPPKREPSEKYFYDGPDPIFLFTQKSSFTSGNIHRQSY